MLKKREWEARYVLIFFIFFNTNTMKELKSQFQDSHGSMFPRLIEALLNARSSGNTSVVPLHCGVDDGRCSKSVNPADGLRTVI